MNQIEPTQQLVKPKQPYTSPELEYLGTFKELLGQEGLPVGGSVPCMPGTPGC